MALATTAMVAVGTAASVVAMAVATAPTEMVVAGAAATALVPCSADGGADPLVTLLLPWPVLMSEIIPEYKLHSSKEILDFIKATLHQLKKRAHGVQEDRSSNVQFEMNSRPNSGQRPIRSRRLKQRMLNSRPISS